MNHHQFTRFVARFHPQIHRRITGSRLAPAERFRVLRALAFLVTMKGEVVRFTRHSERSVSLAKRCMQVPVILCILMSAGQRTLGSCMSVFDTLLALRVIENQVWSGAAQAAPLFLSSSLKIVHPVCFLHHAAAPPATDSKSYRGVPQTSRHRS